MNTGEKRGHKTSTISNAQSRVLPIHQPSKYMNNKVSSQDIFSSGLYRTPSAVSHSKQLSKGGVGEHCLQSLNIQLISFFRFILALLLNIKQAAPTQVQFSYGCEWLRLLWEHKNSIYIGNSCSQQLAYSSRLGSSFWQVAITVASPAKAKKRIWLIA